jgi:hypothetical protein
MREKLFIDSKTIITIPATLILHLLLLNMFSSICFGGDKPIDPRYKAATEKHKASIKQWESDRAKGFPEQKKIDAGLRKSYAEGKMNPAKRYFSTDAKTELRVYSDGRQAVFHKFGKLFTHEAKDAEYVLDTKSNKGDQVLFHPKKHEYYIKNPSDKDHPFVYIDKNDHKFGGMIAKKEYDKHRKIFDDRANKAVMETNSAIESLQKPAVPSNKAANRYSYQKSKPEDANSVPRTSLKLEPNQSLSNHHQNPALKIDKPASEPVPSK